MAIEEQATLQIKFTNQLKGLIKTLIDFEPIYRSVTELHPTEIIKLRANDKIGNDPRLGKFERTMYADTLRKYIEFVHVLIPTYEVERIPLDLDVATYNTLVSKMLDLPIEKNTTRMYAKTLDDSDIKCNDILKGTYTDLQIIERLNAMGDLRHTAGATRNKNESILYMLIEYLKLSDYAKESNPEVDVVQFYFTLDIRVQMNNVLKEFIRYVSHLYNIANSVELQLRPVLTPPNGSTSQNALHTANNELRQLYAVDLLQEKFAALKNQLEKIALYESLLSADVKDTNTTFIQIIEISIDKALTCCKEWQTNLPMRYPKLTSETDDNMAKMIIILLNFNTQLNALKNMSKELNASTASMFKTAESLKSAIEDITKKQAADKPRSNSPPRANIGIFGGAISAASAAAASSRPTSKPEISPHHTARPPSTAPITALPEPPQPKKGSNINRTSSTPGPMGSTSSPQLISIAPAMSPSSGNGKH